MDKVVVYIHGKGGSSDEADIFKPLFCDFNVIGFDYKVTNPWESKEEFCKYFEDIKNKYSCVYVIANSIGAYFFMNSNCKVNKAFFISPVVDMEKLIFDMMTWANVSEERLKKEKEIETDFGEVLSWDYLCYVRSNTISLNQETYILYGENDNLISYESILCFVNKTKANLCVMKGGEHWFHTQEQIEFLFNWLKQIS